MLETLTLHGFKSFAARTTLEFGGGITAVIGPNGSGKSNVVEALRWVTHQARARELRAGRATELIFHGGAVGRGGSAGSKPLGLAEVQAEVRTENGRISLSRRVYRDGAGEQDIGGRPVRARDVQAALRGTGLGAGGLAVIGQGEVSGVVEAPPERLLGYLQEAAGLSAAVAARTETERLLVRAGESLADLELVQRERAGQLQALERAAADALEARRLSTRIHTLEAAAHYARQLALRAELAEAEARAAAVGAEVGAIAAQVATAARQSEEARDALARARSDAAAHAETLGALEAAQSAHAQAERYLAHLVGEAKRLEAELQGLLTEAPTQPEPDLPTLQARKDVARAEAEAREAEARRLDAGLSEARRLAAQRAEAEAREAATREALQAELARLEAARKALSVPAPTDFSGLQTEVEALAARLSGLEAQMRSAREKRQTLLARRGELQAGLAPLMRERDRLEAALNSYARYGEGSRNALRLEHAGIIGSVADVLQVPAELETAVTAALGRRLEQVVVSTADDARDIIAVLKRQGGRATFLPLELLRAGRRWDELLRERGVVGNLADLCPTDPPLVGQSLLAGTLVLESLDDANRIARTHSRRPRLVTLGGEVVEPSGAMTGGQLRDTGGAVLADTRRFHELVGEVEAAQAQLAEVEAALAEAELVGSGKTIGADNATQQLEALRHAHAEAERTFADARAEAEARAREYAARKGSLEADLQRVRGQLAGLDASQPVYLQQAADANASDPAATEARLSELRRAAEQARATEREAAEQHALARELAAAWAAHREATKRAQVLRARIAEGKEAQAEQARHVEGAAAEVARRKAALGEYDAGALARAEAEAAATADAYAGLLGKQNKLTARLDELRLTAARREAALEDVPYGCVPAGTPREWAHELGRARAALEALGPVNARAEADFATARTEYDALQAQVDDAHAATAELRRHLQAQAGAEAKATRAALQSVSAAFATYAGELLGGRGELRAELEPAEGEGAGRITGLTLEVQPGGKRTRTMSLLSAGERTMAGLAFLFALNHANEGAGGLPLAVLDEVDAPLDEANIRRFTAFLTRFAARGTQFILVTHQKATMEVAGALWGVTTDGGGVSRVLSIRQGEAG